jgi:hypothetical protein
VLKSTRRRSEPVERAEFPVAVVIDKWSRVDSEIKVGMGRIKTVERVVYI